MLSLYWPEQMSAKPRRLPTNMRVFNVGSLNIDHVYRTSAFLRPGETSTALEYSVFAGGKGFNQSVALARAGVSTVHIGSVGGDGQWLVSLLRKEGVDTRHIETSGGASGHAIIQVTPSGENAILLHAGANGCVASAVVEAALGQARHGDWVLLQNETNACAQAICTAQKLGLSVAFNAAPMSAKLAADPLLRFVRLFILNEIEAEGLTGHADPLRAVDFMLKKFPDSSTVITLGVEGAIFANRQTLIKQPAFPCQPLDTTAAGDAFTGYFLASVARGDAPGEALREAALAASICVTRNGAAVSIPRREELEVLHPGPATSGA